MAGARAGAPAEAIQAGSRAAVEGAEAVGWVEMSAVVFAAVLDCSHWDSRIRKGRDRRQRRCGKAVGMLNY